MRFERGEVPGDRRFDHQVLEILPRQCQVADGLIDRLRGEGLVVRKGVRDALLKRERNKFLKEEWPLLRARLKRLEIDLETLTESE